MRMNLGSTTIGGITKGTVGVGNMIGHQGGIGMSTESGLKIGRNPGDGLVMKMMMEADNLESSGL
jgi:hypothetical protein